MFCILGHEGAWSPIRIYVWFYWFSCKNRNNRRSATLILLFSTKKQVHSTACHVALFTIISAENRLRRRGRFLLVLHYIKNKKPRVFGKNRVFSAFLWNHTMFFSLQFSIGKTCIFEHRNLSKILFCHVLLDFEKRLKIDHFERGISEHFPIAYDGVYMKLLNPELFISKALTFS